MVVKSIDKKELPKGTLYTTTLELLLNRKASVKISNIAEKTGLDPGWIKSFASGKYDGSSTRVQLLYEHLSGKTLVL